ncbi:NACHT domain-containing protein [Micromonospora sp. NPDC048830]|uniref:NACHT domain-containing protein n=1 Tax=Micromonospora sp. NPDC048830 TaxID=3364257 RepID=UPI00371E9696
MKRVRTRVLRAALVLFASTILVICGLVLVQAFLSDDPRTTSEFQRWTNWANVGALVLGGIALALTLWEKATRAGTTSDHPSGMPSRIRDAAEYLSVESLRYWRRQAKARRIKTPAPLALRWRWAGEDVAVAPERLRPRLPRSGVVTKLREELLGPLGAGARLVLLGEPGAGKSTAMLLLLIDMLEHRQPDEPVPVWLTVGDWDPATTVFDEWVAGVLERDYPSLADPAIGGPGMAGQLVRSGKVAFFLDGLDEMAPAARGNALHVLDQATDGLPVVITCRGVEYPRALKDGQLYGAAVVEILPVDLKQATAFLLAEQLGERLTAWREVTQGMRQAPRSVAARTLTTPLALSLAREAYSDADPKELLDSRAYRTPEKLLRHLFNRQFELAYPDGRQRRHARRWLGWIARNMGENRQLRWWDIPSWVPRHRRHLVFRTAFGIHAGLVLAIPNTLTFGIKAAILAGVVGGCLSVPVSMILRVPTQPRILAVRLPGRRDLLALLTVMGRTMLPVAAGFGTAVIIGRGWASFALVAPVVALFGAFYALLDFWGRPAVVAPVATPVGVYRADRLWARIVSLGLGVTAGLASGVLFGPVWGASTGTILGVGSLLLFSPTVSQELRVAQLAYAVDRRPVRFAPLLQSALDRQILRQVGAVYEFRHTTLQELLAEEPESEASERAAKRATEKLKPGALPIAFLAGILVAMLLPGQGALHLLLTVGVVIVVASLLAMLFRP